LIVLQLLLRIALHSIQFVSGGVLSQTLENQPLSSSEVRLQPFGGDDSRCFEPFNQIPQPPSCTRESLRQIVPIDRVFTKPLYHLAALAEIGNHRSQCKLRFGRLWS